MSNIAICFVALDSVLKNAASLDLVFMLDCTGSMDPYINTAKDRIHEFVDSLGIGIYLRSTANQLQTIVLILVIITCMCLDHLYPDIPLRIAFVGYRDYDHGNSRLAVLKFTEKVEEFQSFVALQKPMTGEYSLLFA